jgi:hypothetical protein
MQTINSQFESSLKLNEIVDRIVSINRAWKVAKEDPSPQINNIMAERLKDQKSLWQVELFRSYPEQVWFKLDLESYPDGSAFSVRWGSQKVFSSDGDIKWNAEHIPVAVARRLLTETELKLAINQKN